jgi:hypothetical protein
MSQRFVWVAVLGGVLTAGSVLSQAAEPPPVTARTAQPVRSDRKSPTTVKSRKVVHSPYALAAAAHAHAPSAGHPVPGHSATMVQGQGTPGHRGARPH